MEVVKVKALKPGITKEGADVEVGAEFETDTKSAEALAAEGWVALPNEEATEQEPEEGGEESPEAGEIERITKALNDQYNRDALADAAKTAGVEFAYDARKGEIITAVIEQEKVEVLLK